MLRLAERDWRRELGPVRTTTEQHIERKHDLVKINCGIESMLVKVLKENHLAKRFYEKLGGQMVREGSASVNGIEFANVTYGWRSIRGIF